MHLLDGLGAGETSSVHAPGCTRVCARSSACAGPGRVARWRFGCLRGYQHGGKAATGERCRARQFCLAHRSDDGSTSRRDDAAPRSVVSTLVYGDACVGPWPAPWTGAIRGFRAVMGHGTSAGSVGGRKQGQARSSTPELRVGVNRARCARPACRHLAAQARGINGRRSRAGPWPPHASHWNRFSDARAPARSLDPVGAANERG